MINLLKNEFFKVIKKRGFLIMIIVMFGYAILTNVIYKTVYSDLEQISESSYQGESYYKTKDDSLLSKVDDKTSKQFNKLVEQYDSGSWQYNYLLDNNAYNYLYEINSYELKLTDDKNNYEEAKKNYNNLLDILKKDDWRSIVKQNKEDYEKLLQTASLTAKKELQITIEEQDIRLDKNISFETSNKNDTLNKYISSKKELLNYENKDLEKLSDNDLENYEEIRRDYLSSEYALKHNIPLDDYASSKGILENFFNEYSLMLIIMMIMIAGSITSQEFSKGTIKLLLVRPYSRIKILLSKYIMVLINILMATAIMFIIQLLVGSIFFGLDSLKTPVIVYSSIKDSIEVMNVFKYFALNFLSCLPYFIIIATLAFCASTLFCNTSLAIVIGFVGFVIGNISSLLESFKNWWVKYVIFFNWDFTPYIFNNRPPIDGLNLNFSIVTCLVYLLIMLIPTFIIFKRKDINNV